MGLRRDEPEAESWLSGTLVCLQTHDFGNNEIRCSVPNRQVHSAGTFQSESTFSTDRDDLLVQGELETGAQGKALGWSGLSAGIKPSGALKTELCLGNDKNHIIWSPSIFSRTCQELGFSTKFFL